MENILNKQQIEEAVEKILLEDISKVSRFQFHRIEVRLEDLINSIEKTTEELDKLKKAIPSGLHSLSNSRLENIKSNLIVAKSGANQLGDKIRKYKKNLYSQPQEVKK